MSNNGYDHQGLATSGDDGGQIDSKHPSYAAMGTKYTLVNRLLGGRPAMQGEGTAYLPMFPNEKEDVYRLRLSNTFLNPAFSVAVESHSSKPFSQKIVLEGHIDDKRLAGLVDNTDGQGNDLTEFGKRLFVDGDQYGMTHILADFNVSHAETLQQEEAEGNTARLVHVKCLDLFYWDSDDKGLTEIRYHREATVPNGTFGKKQVKQIVRWSRERWEIWQEDDGDTLHVKDNVGKDYEKVNSQPTEWKIIDSGNHSFGRIPLTTIYFKRTGFMTSEPPNYELAETVLEHYQDMSDQKRLESVARIGILTASGYQPDELKGFSISSNSLIQGQSPDAEINVVEHTGAAVKVGRDSLKILEDRMETLSLKPEVNRTSGDVTASEVTSNAFNSCSDLLSWTAAVESGLQEAFAMTYAFINQDVPDDFKLSVYKDFVIVGTVADLGSMIQAKEAGILSAKVVAFEFKRRSVIAIEHDLDEMISDVEADEQKKMNMAIETAKATAPPKPEGKSNEETNTSKPAATE